MKKTDITETKGYQIFAGVRAVYYIIFLLILIFQRDFAIGTLVGSAMGIIFGIMIASMVVESAVTKQVLQLTWWKRNEPTYENNPILYRLGIAVYSLVAVTLVLTMGLSFLEKYNSGDRAHSQSMMLTIDGEFTTESPSDNTILEAISALRDDPNSFMILGHSDRTYIQSINRGDGYLIEYQEGSLDTHHASANNDLEQKTVEEIFIRYNNNDASWRDIIEWKPLESEQ